MSANVCAICRIYTVCAVHAICAVCAVCARKCSVFSWYISAICIIRVLQNFLISPFIYVDFFVSNNSRLPSCIQHPSFFFFQNTFGKIHGFFFEEHYTQAQKKTLSFSSFPRPLLCRSTDIICILAGSLVVSRLTLILCTYTRHSMSGTDLSGA